MSLDSRLRTDLREIAATVDPAAEAPLRAVLARRDRRTHARHVVSRMVVAAACLALVGALTVWWVAGGTREPDVVIDPHPLAGSYEATLAGDLAGDWRLRFDGATASLLAPDSGPLGTRLALGTYDVRDDVLTTDLLADGLCTGSGAYTWTTGATGLTLTVADDDCGLRARLLTSTTWSAVSGTPLSEGTYETPPLTIGQLRATALAAGFSAAEVDDELTVLAGADSVTYTLQVEGGTWTEYETVDGGVPAVGWSGPYTVVDSATVVAGEPPCGPVTYDYRFDVDQVTFAVLADECAEGGRTPVGELIAQATIYQTAPFARLDP